jgi:hypothetical protein
MHSHNAQDKTRLKPGEPRNQNFIPSIDKRLFLKLPIPTLGPTQRPAMQMVQVVLSPVMRHGSDY